MARRDDEIVIECSRRARCSHGERRIALHDRGYCTAWLITPVNETVIIPDLTPSTKHDQKSYALIVKHIYRLLISILVWYCQHFPIFLLFRSDHV